MTAPSRSRSAGATRAERTRALLQLLAASIEGAACHGQGAWWSACETRHLAASTAAEAAAAAGEALRLCDGCIALRRCRLLAELGRYSGLAAGALYVDGTRRSADTVLRRRPPCAGGDVARAG